VGKRRVPDGHISLSGQKIDRRFTWENPVNPDERYTVEAPSIAFAGRIKEPARSQ
jgi:hypothetical protein